MLLLQDIAVNEINVLQANFNSLVLENEQLKSEINEMKEKLKEKIEMDEFEALEKQTQKDHEVRCIAINTEIRIIYSRMFSRVYSMYIYLDVDSPTGGVISYIQQQNE